MEQDGGSTEVQAFYAEEQHPPTAAYAQHTAPMEAVHLSRIHHTYTPKLVEEEPCEAGTFSWLNSAESYTLNINEADATADAAAASQRIALEVDMLKDMTAEELQLRMEQVQASIETATDMEELMDAQEELRVVEEALVYHGRGNTLLPITRPFVPTSPCGLTLHSPFMSPFAPHQADAKPRLDVFAPQPMQQKGLLGFLSQVGCMHPAGRCIVIHWRVDLTLHNTLINALLVCHPQVLGPSMTS